MKGMFAKSIFDKNISNWSVSKTAKTQGMFNNTKITKSNTPLILKK